MSEQSQPPSPSERTQMDIRSPTHASMSDIRESESRIDTAMDVSANTPTNPLIQRYMEQLLHGCSNPNCQGLYCASNANNQISSSDIFPLASELAKQGEKHLCAEGVLRSHSQTQANKSFSTDPIISQPPVPPTISSTDLQRLILDAKESNNWDILTSLLRHLFSSQLLSGFKMQNSGTLNERLSSVYSIISKSCPPSVIESVLLCSHTHMEILRNKPKWEQKDFTLICCLLSNPAWLDSAYHASLLGDFVEFLADLPENHKADLTTEWITFKFGSKQNVIDLKHHIKKQQLLSDSVEYRRWTHMRNEMANLVGMFQHFITMRIYTNPAENGFIGGINKDRRVIAATKCLDIFYHLNEELQLIPFEDFYNDSINDHIEIKEDFPHWKAKEGFSFCNYPFILNTATKCDILKVESMVQMRHELQDAFFRAMFIGVNSPYLVLDIRRDHIVRDALFQLENRKTQDLKKQLKVQFVGEEGVDEGGVQKEFFQLITREIFNEKYGIFRQTESNFHWFTCNQGSLSDSVMLEEIRLVGRLIGLAIYNGVILDIRFPPALYKKLLKKPVGFEDLRILDPMLAKSLEDVLDYEGDVENTFNRNFQIDMPVMGGLVTIDLKPNGQDCPLTNDNRVEFVKLYQDMILNKSIDQSFKAFKEGFDSVCQNSAISLFRPEELELLVCGSSDLDFEALRKVTVYDGGYTFETPVIRYFWEIVLEFNEEKKKRLLFFATGSDRVPIGGLSKMNFVIAKSGPDSERLPSSHTCFNVLLLPEYNSRSKLFEKLINAMQNSEGFGMI